MRKENRAWKRDTNKPRYALERERTTRNHRLNRISNERDKLLCFPFFYFIFFSSFLSLSFFFLFFFFFFLPGREKKALNWGDHPSWAVASKPHWLFFFLLLIKVGIFIILTLLFFFFFLFFFQRERRNSNWVLKKLSVSLNTSHVALGQLVIFIYLFLSQVSIFFLYT